MRLLLLLLLTVLPTFGGNISLGWFANPEPYVSGYKVYCGTAPRTYSYTNSLSGINTTNITFFSLTNGVKYYFAVKAIADNGLESDFSDEVSCDWSRPSAPAGVKIKSVTLTLEVNTP
jgi:hypothetical protein